MYRFGMTTNNRVRKPWEYPPRPSTSIAGRQTGRFSINQYARRSSSIPRQNSPNQQNSGEQPFFRPPTTLNYLFQVESDENESNKGDESAENDESDNDLDDKNEERDLVDFTNESQEATNIIDITTPPKSGTQSSSANTSAQKGKTGETSQSTQLSQSSTDSSQPYMSDIEAESWLQLRFAQEEAKKKRTVYAPFRSPTPQPPKPHFSPTRPHYPPSPTPIRPVNAPWGPQSFRRHQNPWLPQRYAPIDRKHEMSVKRLEALEAAFKRLEERGQMTERCEIEKMEYESCKAKVDGKIALTSIEKKRINDILRNIERREYSWSVGQMVQQKAGAKKKDELITHAPEEVDVVGAKAGPSLPAPPASAGEPKSASTNSNPPTNNAAQPDIAGEYGQPVVEVESTDDEEDDDIDDDQDDVLPEPVWAYHVYRTNIDSTDPNPAPVHISSHLNRRRAENMMRDQIKSCYGNLKERTRLEFRATFDEDFTEQTVEFASGRTVVVRVEREIHEQPVKHKKRTKLEHIPSKIYTVIEQVTTTFVGDGNGETEPPTSTDAGGTKYTEMSECFVFRKDANAQANRLMLAHLTSHLDEGERFDLDVTGNIDTEARLYLHELEAGDRLYDKKHVLPTTADGTRKEVYIRVLEHLVRGPRN